MRRTSNHFAAGGRNHQKERTRRGQKDLGQKNDGRNPESLFSPLSPVIRRSKNLRNEKRDWTVVMQIVGGGGNHCGRSAPSSVIFLPPIFLSYFSSVRDPPLISLNRRV